jgi:large subunit ribosomal protein L5
MKQFGYSSVMQAPRLLKISINKGVGEAALNKKVMDDAVEEIRIIAGQHPKVRHARKAVSNFKLRLGMAVGVAVTLRNEKMYEFLDRLITLTLPRVRDFRGIPDKSFDGRGNYSLGITEQIVFPEINVDKIGQISGLDVTFVTSAKTDEEAYALLKAFGMPFVRRDAA